MEKVYGNYKKLPQEEIMQFEPEVDTNDDDLDLDLDLDSDLEVAELVDQVGNIWFQLDEDNDSEEEVNDDLDEDIEGEESQWEEDLVKESKVDDASPSDPKIVQEISRLTSYYNSGQMLSKMMSGKRFKENSDLDEEGTNDTGGIYDVAALIVDRMKLPNGTVKWIEKQEFAMNAVHIKKYETMEQDKILLRN